VFDVARPGVEADRHGVMDVPGHTAREPECGRELVRRVIRRKRVLHAIERREQLSIHEPGSGVKTKKCCPELAA
jgi:hypothetical protein